MILQQYAVTNGLYSLVLYNVNMNLPNIAKISSRRLRELRTQSGFTQRQVAEILGIRQQSYIRYEYGTSQPSLESLAKLAKFYSVSADYLLGISEY